MNDISNILKPKSEEEINNILNNTSSSYLIHKGTHENNLWILNKVLDLKDLNPYDVGNVLEWAIIYNNYELVKKCLTHKIDKIKLVDVIEKIKHSRRGNRIMDLIFSVDYFDPSISDNRLIRWASTRGYVNLVTRLLKDKRVDPSDLDNFALEGAKLYGHQNIIDLLEKDKRVISKLKKKKIVENILKPKSKKDINEAALAIKDPNELMRLSLTTLKDSDLLKEAFKRGADPLKALSFNVNDTELQDVINNELKKL